MARLTADDGALFFCGMQVDRSIRAANSWGMWRLSVRMSEGGREGDAYVVTSIGHAQYLLRA